MKTRVAGSLAVAVALTFLVLSGSPAMAGEIDVMQPLEIDFLGANSIRSSEPVALAAFSNVSLDTAQTEAAESAPKAAPDDWHFLVAFTLWAPGIDGTVGARGLTTDVSASFIDVLDDSSSLFGFGGAAEYRGEKFGAYLNGFWCSIEIDEGTPLGTANITNDIGLVGFGVLYEVGRWSIDRTANGDMLARDMTLTLYGGARFSSVSIDFDFPVLPSVSHERTWIDPMIGAKMSYPLSQNWSIVFGGDIGGFGAASDFAWSAAAAISWDFHIKNLPSSLQFGYMAIGDDYTNGSGTEEFVWDTILHGVVMNFVIRF